jgi:hypothetical protein
MKNFYYFFKRTVFLTWMTLLTFVCAILGCGSLPEKFPDIPVQQVSRYKTYQDQNGILTAIDPFIEEERLLQYFGKDLLFYGLLPINILLENKSDRSFIILRENIILFTDNNKPVGSESLAGTKQPIQNARNEGRMALTTTGFLTTMLFPAIGILMFAINNQKQADAENVLRNITSKALNDKSIFKGDQYNGFVYFQLKDISVLNDYLNLQIKLKDLKTENISILNFRIDAKEINKRINKAK